MIQKTTQIKMAMFVGRCEVEKLCKAFRNITNNPRRALKCL